MLPHRVTNVEDFWIEPPDTQSDMCDYWVASIDAGCEPDADVLSMGYYGASEFLGVYIWEYVNTIYPKLAQNII